MQLGDLVGSEDQRDPLFLGGFDGLPINLLDDDINEAFEIDDILSLFDDEHHTASDSRVYQADFLSSTPATSESGNGNLQAKSPENEDLTNNCSKINVEEEKRQARMKRNRENAHLSRMRKKQQLLNLQQSCQNLKQQNSQLNLFIQRLAAENCLLRHHLNDVCKNANFAVPSVPSVLGQPQAKASSGEDTRHSENSSLQSQSTEKGKNAPKSSETGNLPSPLVQERRNVKRRTMGGAGAAFLTLFSIFLFAGPMSITPNESLGTESLKLLPEGQFKSIQSLHQKGRTLMSTEETMSDGIDLSDYLSQTVEDLLKDKRNIDLPKHALSRLEDIAPHALSLDKDDLSAGDKSSLPASSVFAALTEKYFESSGLEAPRMCEKVFTFHSDDMSSQYQKRSKKNVEKFILGTHGFKGRSSGLKVEEEGKSTDKSLKLVAGEESGNFIDSDDILLPTEISEPQLVSVMLPANASRTTKSGISAIDHLYVVILDPQNTFSTYACQLPKSLII